MPMIDFVCDSCGTRTEHFFLPSNIPDQVDCEFIKYGSEAGDEEYPCSGTARRIDSLPGEYQPRNAQPFTPITIWVSDTNPNQVSWPGNPNEPVQEGYHKVVLTDFNQADKIVRQLDNVKRLETEFDREMNKQYFDERTKERRDNIRAKIGGNARASALHKAVCEYVDKKRDKKYSKPLNPGSHLQIREFDRSNRMPYAGKETGWRDRHS